jgi:hypothetical protein
MSHTTTFQNATLKVVETLGASSNNTITPNAVNIIGINNDQSENTNYSTSNATDSLVPTIPYIRGNSIANNAFTIGGHYADYTSGNSSIKRIYTGFYRDANPSLGAISASTQDGLLDPNATKLDIAVRSNLDLQSTQEIKNASNIKTTTITDKNTSTGNQGQILSSTSTGIEWITPTPIVSTLEYFITATSPFFQYPPVAPTQTLITSYQYYGWYFINSVALRKIDWFFAPDYEMTVADVKGLYLNYFNVTTTTNDDLPFISIYTKPTGVNDAIPGFAHSVATYIANFTPAVATPYSSFMNISGVQPDPFPYGHQLGAMILSPVQPNPRGQYLGTEEVLAISIGTNSTSPVGQCNFIFQKLGICLSEGNAELIMNPQNVLDPTVTTVTATTSVKPTTILDLNNQAGTAGQILSSTSTGIDWIDPPSGTTPNIGQVITAGGDAGGGSITNVASITATTSMKPITILDKDDQAGSAGQILSSTGTGLDWVNAPATPNIGQVITAGGDAGGGSITNVASITATTSVKPITILDKDDQAGSAGQILSSTGTGIDWVDNPTPYISSSGVSSGGITSLPSINAVGAMTIGDDVATTGLTIGSGNYTTAMGGNVGFGGNSVSGLNNIDGNSAVLAIGTQATTTNVNIGKTGQTVNVAGSLALGGNTITGVDAIDGNSGALSIGRGAGTTSNIGIGKTGIAVDLINTVRFGADGALSAGTAGQVVTSGGTGAYTRWANIALTNVAGTELTPNASASSPFQLFTSTAITGTSGSTYLFMFRTNLTSTNSAGTDNEFIMTLTTTSGNTTPTSSNSNNVLNPSVTINTQRPDEATSLAMTKHYGAIGTAVRQDRTLNFSYLYTFPSSTTTTFGVWSWTNTSFPTSSFIRKNVQLSYIKLS